MSTPATPSLPYHPCPAIVAAIGFSIKIDMRAGRYKNKVEGRAQELIIDALIQHNRNRVEYPSSGALCWSSPQEDSNGFSLPNLLMTRSRTGTAYHSCEERDKAFRNPKHLRWNRGFPNSEPTRLELVSLARRPPSGSFIRLRPRTASPFSND